MLKFYILLGCLLAAGCGGGGTDGDHAEILKARAAKQDAEWVAMERRDEIEVLEARYRDLLEEFAQYQATGCKQGAK